MSKADKSHCHMCKADILFDKERGELWLTERTEYSFVQRDEQNIPHEAVHTTQTSGTICYLCGNCFRALLRDTVYKKEVVTHAKDTYAF